MERTQTKQRKEERTTNENNKWLENYWLLRLRASEGGAQKSPNAAEADKVF